MNAIQIIITILTSVLASSGLWTLILKKMEKKDALREMVLGLAHDRIMHIGLSYIARDPQYITKEEYENLHDYLYLPYEKLGGNGSAKRVMLEVEKIPLKEIGRSELDEIIK